MDAKIVKDAASDLAKDIVQNLPIKEIYRDALSPGAKQVGYLIEDMAKTLRLVLAPAQVTAILQDRFRDFIQSSIGKVPVERRVIPSDAILGPALEAIRFETEGSDIEQMFSELLRKASDALTASCVHPSYVRTIRDLSPDEARMLAELAPNNIICGEETRDSWTTYHFSSEQFLSVSFRENLDLYTNRLISAMLVEAHNVSFDRRVTLIDKGTFAEVRLRLSRLGRHFFETVTPED